MQKMKLGGSLLLCTFLSACITTYRGFPEDMVHNPPKAKTFDTLYYQIKPFNVLSAGGGETAMQEVFRQKTPFRTTEKTDAPPHRGLYCSVEVLYRPRR